jgi:crotonobetainyl-CoA:carnitine CoA-transferase CaiB-like acyl-CoA transferase
MDSLPLFGTTVIELCHSLAGPYAASILADLGAEVIKIESPEKGDYARDWGPPFAHGTSTAFHTFNRNKRALALDLRDQVARQQLAALILARADVVIQNLRPSAIDKLGLDAARLMAEKPALIYYDLGAFGRVGPLRGRPGYDPLMQAYGGLMSVTGVEGGEPVRVGTSIIDMGAGMWAALGIIAALNRRHRTGKGCHVTTSLFETALGWMTTHIAGYLAGGEVRSRMGSGVAEIVPHQAFATTDGHVMVAADNDSLFRALAALLGRSELADDARFATNSARVSNRRVLIPMLEEVFGTRPTAHWLSGLEEVGVPVAPILSTDQVVASPQTAALGMLQRAPDLDLTLVGLPVEFDGVRPPFRRSAPKLGEHKPNDLLPAMRDTGKDAIS